MKHIKGKIITVILLSILLVFLTSVALVNIMLPHRFENEAKRTLEYEIDYINRFPSTADLEKDFDVLEQYLDSYEGGYFSGDISFIDLSDNSGYSTGFNSNANFAEIELRDYCATHTVKNETCYRLRTKRGYYIFLRYEEQPLDGTETTAPMLMYINLQPIIQYFHYLNRFFIFVFFGIAVVMGAIGYRLGKMIEDAQQTQSRFFQNSSHELKTPLMAIQGYAEGIQTGVIDSRVGAEVILQESDRMTRLVEELLFVSKIDSHRLTLNCTGWDVRDILYDCLESVTLLQQKENIQLIPDFTESSVVISCDEEQLRRAFLNILVNGLRHCKTTLTVSCQAEKNDVVIRFADDGDGIAEKDLPHIFDRFYSGRNGITGIGLALASEIVHLHRGSITARNSETGAVFEIRLPLAK